VGIDSNYGAYESVAANAGLAYPVWTDTRKLKRLREEIFVSRIKAR